MLSSVTDYIKREDFKAELKDVLHPIFDILAEVARPYFLYAIFFVLVNFVLLVGIFFYVMGLKKSIA